MSLLHGTTFPYDFVEASIRLMNCSKFWKNIERKHSILELLYM